MDSGQEGTTATSNSANQPKIDGRKTRPKISKEEANTRRRERYADPQKKPKHQESARARMQRLREEDKNVDPDDDDAVALAKRRHLRKIEVQRNYLDRKRYRGV